MTTTAETGRAGERAAAEHLRQAGYEIRDTNWRAGRALTRAAARYLRTAGWQGEVQFDLAAVTLSDDGRADVELIERAMEHHW